MDIFPALAEVLSSPKLLFAVVAAAAAGMIVGAMPGLTAAAAIAMLLPATYRMEPLVALAFLYVIGKSARYGGCIAAILFNTPGTAASAATQTDGYPLAQQGKAGKAMKVATLSSVIGDLMGDMLLITGIGFIAALALKLGPPEVFAVYFAAFVVIGSVIGKSAVKGLASASFGALVAMVGLDPISAEERYTFGIFQLANGVHLVPLMIGIFVLAEVFSQLTKRNKPMPNYGYGDDTLSWREYKPCLPHVIRGGFIGAVIGVLPGLGSAVAAFVSYGEGKRRANNKEEWGKGAMEGIAAPESANNAVSGPSMAPLLTLGIPGSAIGAVLLGVFLVHGIQVGPGLFVHSRELIYQLFACGVLGIAAYGLMGYFGAARVAGLITKIPQNILYPVIFLTSFAASYSFRGAMFDVLVMLCAGVAGWLMRRFGFNTGAFVIAFVLAGGAEESFRQSLLMSDNGAWIFTERPLSLALITTAIATTLIRLRPPTKQKQHPRS